MTMPEGIKPEGVSEQSPDEIRRFYDLAQTVDPAAGVAKDDRKSGSGSPP
jgi:hypothetical protein